MTAADRAGFGAAMAKCAAAFGVSLKPERVAVYFERLQDRPLGFVYRAVNAAIEGATRFPTVAELRRLGRADAQDADPARALGEPVTPAYQHAVLALVHELGGQRVGLDEYCARLAGLHRLSTDSRAQDWEHETHDAWLAARARLERRLTGADRLAHIGRSATAARRGAAA